MAKSHIFEPGQKIKLVANPTDEMPIGSEFVVAPQSGEASPYSVCFFLGNEVTWRPADYFELASESKTESPIRTRREIVPGFYGYIGIENISGRSACVGVRGVEGKYGDRYLSPDELREAAHLFNQIAEVLEENAG